MTRLQAIEKVQKLLALSNSPNENEAALAAAHAKRILSEFNLSAIELGNDTENGIGYVKEYTVIIDNQYAQWVQELLNAIKLVYNCDIFLTRDIKGVVFIGEEINAKIAAYTFEYLIKSVNRMCEQAIEKKDSGDWMDITRFIGLMGINSFRGIVNNDLFAKSYKIGATLVIIQKLKEQIEISDKEAALIVVMHDAVVEYVDKKYHGAQEYEFSENSDVDEWALRMGVEDGRDLQIREALER